MTSSYTNIQVLASDAEAVRGAVDQRKLGICKIIGRPDSPWIGVYAFMTEGDYPHLREWAEELSEQLNTAAFGFMVEGGELFKFALYEGGELIDEYCSNPGYPFESKSATGGDVTILIRFGADGTTKAMLKRLLHAGKTAQTEAERKVVADKLAQGLAPLIGIPRLQMCTGYNYLKRAGVGKTSDDN